MACDDDDNEEFVYSEEEDVYDYDYTDDDDDGDDDHNNDDHDDDDDYEYDDSDRMDTSLTTTDDVNTDTATSTGGNIGRRRRRAPPQQQQRQQRYYRPKSGIRMLAAENLRPEMTRRVADVTEALEVSAAAAAVLLRQFRWSKELLLAAYMGGDGGGDGDAAAGAADSSSSFSSDRVLLDAGVYHRCRNAVPAADRTCPICFETAATAMAMPCGHSFCMDCWEGYCDCAVREGPSCVLTTCPEVSCTEIVTEEEFCKALTRSTTRSSSAAAAAATTTTTSSLSLVSPSNNNNNDGLNDKNTNSDDPRYQSFLRYQLRSFVECNSLTRWCPGAGCERVAAAVSELAMQEEDYVAVCDVCDRVQFCVKCGEEPHCPATCHDVVAWRNKCRDESESAKWIMVNTKQCPKCYVRIEKNQGCNHMTCRHCRHGFCWICLGSDCGHGGCNKYSSKNGEGAGDEDSERARVKRELDRYLHYYQRYHAHTESQAFAEKKLSETADRMEQLQQQRSTIGFDSGNDSAAWSDVQFLKRANETLVDARRLLKYTYVFAYYRTDPGSSSATGSGGSGGSGGGSNNKGAAAAAAVTRMMMTKQQQDLFEYTQGSLQEYTEKLSESSEKALHEIDRMAVVNQTGVVENFMKKLVDHVKSGMMD